MWYRPIHLALASLALALVAAPARSQVVRGTVHERVSGTLLPGVLITLETADTATGDSAAPGRGVLTSLQGTYAIRAPGPGRYRVVAKRIGVRRLVSDVVVLAPGETRQLDLDVDPILHALPEVAVSRRALCTTRRDQASRVAALWDEAFTALRATEITQRDRLFRARVVRYIRTLEPRTLKVLNESRQQVSGSFVRPFTSLSADSLSRAGYWSGMREDSIWYAIPDAEVLASSAFVRDHCFTAVNGDRDHRGLTGLAFEPVAGREQPDIHGTIWLDARTFELRQVDFQYTRLPRTTDYARIRGEIRFASLPNGTWIVRRWFTRVPQSKAVALGQIGPYRMPDTLHLRGVSFLIEDGGDVTSRELALFEEAASVAGVVRDSSGRPLVGAQVRLSGTRFETRTDESGRYRLDSVPPGLYTARVTHGDYDAFGVSIGTRDLAVEVSKTPSLEFRAPRADALAAQLCGGRKAVRGRATLLIVLRDSATSAPLAHVPLRLTWVEYGRRVRGVPQALQGSTGGTTAADGRIAFCALPAATQLDLFIPVDDTHAIPLRSLTGTALLRPNEVRAWEVRIRKPW